MEDMDEYMRCLDVIAETNHIEAVEPCLTDDGSLERDGETRILDSTINAETFKKSLIIEDPDDNVITEVIDVNRNQPSSTNYSTRPPSTDKLLITEEDHAPVSPFNLKSKSHQASQSDVLKYMDKDFLLERNKDSQYGQKE